MHFEEKTTPFLKSYGNRLLIDTKKSSIVQRKGTKTIQLDTNNYPKSAGNRLIIDTKNNSVVEPNGKKLVLDETKGDMDVTYKDGTADIENEFVIFGQIFSYFFTLSLLINLIVV